MYGGKFLYPRASEQSHRLEVARLKEDRLAEEAKFARREAFDKWNIREKPGPAGAEVFSDRGPDKLTSVVHYGQRGDPAGAELAEAFRAARSGTRPREAAGIEKTRAEAAGIRYGIASERGTEGLVEDILKAKGAMGKAKVEELNLAIKEAQRGARLRDEAEITEAERLEAARIAEETEMPSPEAAKPGRKLRPSIKKALFGGPISEASTLTPAPLFSPKGGWGEAYESFLGRPLKEAYEYAFPRSR